MFHVHINYGTVVEYDTLHLYGAQYRLANQNLTKFINLSALFPQVQGNAGQEIREPFRRPMQGKKSGVNVPAKSEVCIGLMGSRGAVIWVHGRCCHGERGQSRWESGGSDSCWLLCVLCVVFCGCDLCGGVTFSYHERVRKKYYPKYDYLKNKVQYIPIL